MSPSRADDFKDASPKKRKRDKTEEEKLARKKHRSKSKLRHDGPQPAKTVVKGEEPQNSKMLSLVNGKQESEAREIVVNVETNIETNKRRRRQHAVAGWKLSSPMGGRMLDIDPIFSHDERHLILTYNTSIQVYTAADSLLVRRIPLPITKDGELSGAHIVASALSKVSPGQLWVATSDGRIWNIDWTSGTGAEEPYTVNARAVVDFTVDEIAANGVSKDVLIVVEVRRRRSGQIMAYDKEALSKQNGQIVHTYDDGMQSIRTVPGGRMIVGISKETIHLGVLSTKEADSEGLAGLRYQFYSFAAPDQVTSLDLRLEVHPLQNELAHSTPVLADLVLGCARGAIYLYADILSKFGLLSNGQGKGLQPRKYHWHRRAVHTVKFSQDGNYIISGGSESVLVSWQLDTGKVDVLPHLGASVENVVVSPGGASYAIHLDDNSTMVLSTAEMTPTTYVSGIQSLVFSEQQPKDAVVRRVWQASEEISKPVAAAINPMDATQLLVNVGNGLRASMIGAETSMPLLQIFDTASFQNISKQALTRVAPTESNVTSKGFPILEPSVTQLEFSRDGKWLATVDEWQPPERDVESLVDDSKAVQDLCRERREIYLKFWEASEDGKSFQLVSRVNEAHYTLKSDAIYDLARDETSTRFATIGADGVARIWVPKARQRDGIPTIDSNGQPLKGWECSQAIALEGLSHTADELVHIEDRKESAQSGALAFSEDGSILFVALGDASESSVYVVDTASGKVRHRLPDLFTGEIKAIRVLSSCLVLLSDDLRVYDIVADELKYGITLEQFGLETSRLVQLAADSRSGNFALAVPVSPDGQPRPRKGTTSDLLVFSLELPEPQLVQPFEQLITSLLPAARGKGFIVLDSAAQVWSVAEGTEETTLARPLADIHLDDIPEESAEQSAMVVVNGHEDEADDEDMEDGAAEEDAQDDQAHAAVIAPQRLTEIFDVGPAFAMPPIEDLFYQVAGLISTKAPSAVST